AVIVALDCQSNQQLLDALVNPGAPVHIGNGEAGAANGAAVSIASLLPYTMLLALCDQSQEALACKGLNDANVIPEWSLPATSTAAGNAASHNPLFPLTNLVSGSPGCGTSENDEVSDADAPSEGGA